MLQNSLGISNVNLSCTIQVTILYVSKGHAVDCIKCEVVVTYFLFDRQPVGPILKGQLSSSRDLTLEDGTNRLSQNNGNKLPLHTV